MPCRCTVPTCPGKRCVTLGEALRAVGELAGNARLQAGRDANDPGGQAGQGQRCTNFYQARNEIAKFTVKLEEQIKRFALLRSHGPGGVVSGLILEKICQHGLDEMAALKLFNT